MTIIYDNGIHRNMTANELAEYTKTSSEAVAAFEEQKAAVEAAVAAKVSARAKLKALGLTDAEIAALVG